MRVSRQEMESGHRRIVEGTARLIREKGLKGTSVADAMTEAGLTHGGFYRHFASKDDLAVAALGRAFDELASPLELRQQVQPASEVVAEFTALYLSDQHVQNPGQGCPMAALGSEMGREGPALRAAFSEGVHRLLSALEAGMPGGPATKHQAALRHVCLLVGAVMLARATDTALAEDLVDAVRSAQVHSAPPA